MEENKDNKIDVEDHDDDNGSIDDQIEKLEQDSTQPKKRLMPKKADYRMRAHINPLNDTPFPYPTNPDYVNWKLHFPKFFGGTDEENQKIYVNTNEYPLDYPERVPDEFNGRKGRCVDFVDVGCGFGGLLMALSQKFPDNLSFGMEIRDKLCNYVGEKIRALRIEHPGQYNNISVIRMNAMRHMTNYFRKGQLSKLFFCFADPHFKRSNYRRRIIGVGFLAEYAYLLKKGGRIYSITDVEELHEWNVKHLSEHKLFRRLSEEELANDICVELMKEETEEAKKVTRNGGKKFVAVFEKLIDN